MGEKQKLNKKQRAHKISGGTARGARRTHLTDVQKILIGNGGMGHFLRKGQQRVPAKAKL